MIPSPVDALVEPEAVIREIDEAVARWPLRNEGTYWLRAKQWDAIKAELTHLKGQHGEAAALLLSQQARLESSQAECKDALATAERNNALVNELQARVGELEAKINAARDSAESPDFDYATLSDEELAVCLERVHPFNTWMSIEKGCIDAARRIRVARQSNEALEKQVDELMAMTLREKEKNIHMTKLYDQAVIHLLRFLEGNNYGHLKGSEQRFRDEVRRFIGTDAALSAAKEGK